MHLSNGLYEYFSVSFILSPIIYIFIRDEEMFESMRMNVKAFTLVE